jgi:gamma-glutamyltranspeptidase/glutathione hydrolase
MAPFTTRPEIQGNFGVVATTHWIASSVGMSMLERGGNAFDAAVAAGFVLQVVEPHLVGPGGDLPAIVYSAARGKVEVICAQGPAPAGATIERYRSEGLSLIPGDGLLATVIPGAFDGWMLLLRDYGSMRLRDVLEPAIHYCEVGHPVLARVSDTIKGMADFFRDEWPSSYETWLPGGVAPEPQANVRNPVLAQTWRRILAEAETAGSREAQIEKARDAFYRGFVAEAIDGYLAKAEVMDSSGMRHRGVLRADDLATWSASVENPLTYDYHGWTVAKTGPWGQGPVLLQSLALLKGFDIAAMDPAGEEFVHVVTEAMKLAFADREIYYGDPNFCDAPIDRLLADGYAAERRHLIGPNAATELLPGRLPGFEAQLDATMRMLGEVSGEGAVYEPTMSHLSQKRGDTVHIDAIDRHGNMISVTPSGGWLQSSPTVPGLGFCLNSRAQMFWLEPGLPTSLAPGKRPRTTLSPSLALFEGKPRLVFGTPGGDQQDQWQLSFFLRHVHHHDNLQQAIDAPLFHTSHFPGSFHPRTREAASLTAEENFAPKVLEALRRRGHRLTVAEPWSVGRLTAAARNPDGLLRAAATPRLMQAYAVGR